MKKLLIILFALMLVGCATQKHASSTETSHKKDTVTVEKIEYVEKEIIKSVPDSASMQALLECDSLGQVYIKQLLDYQSGKYIKPKIKLVDNIIKVEAKVDSMAIYREYHKKYSKEDSLSSVIQTLQKEEEIKADENIQKTKQLNAYKWILISIGVILLICFGIFLYVKKTHPRSR